MNLVKCRICQKEVDHCEVLRFPDATGWCSSECWRAEGTRIKEAMERLKKEQDCGVVLNGQYYGTRPL